MDRLSEQAKIHSNKWASSILDCCFGSAILNLFAFVFLTKIADSIILSMGIVGNEGSFIVCMFFSLLLAWWSFSLLLITWGYFYKYYELFTLGTKILLLIILIYLSLSIVFLFFYSIILIMNTKENLPYFEMVHKYLLINEYIIIAVLVLLVFLFRQYSLALKKPLINPNRQALIIDHDQLDKNLDT